MKIRALLITKRIFKKWGPYLKGVDDLPMKQQYRTAVLALKRNRYQCPSSPLFNPTRSIPSYVTREGVGALLTSWRHFTPPFKAKLSQLTDLRTLPEINFLLNLWSLFLINNFINKHLSIRNGNWRWFCIWILTKTGIGTIPVHCAIIANLDKNELYEIFCTLPWLCWRGFQCVYSSSYMSPGLMLSNFWAESGWELNVQ